MGACSDCYCIKLCVVGDMTWKVIYRQNNSGTMEGETGNTPWGKCEGR